MSNVTRAWLVEPDTGEEVVWNAVKILAARGGLTSHLVIPVIMMIIIIVIMCGPHSVSYDFLLVSRQPTQQSPPHLSVAIITIPRLIWSRLSLHSFSVVQSFSRCSLYCTLSLSLASRTQKLATENGKCTWLVGDVVVADGATSCDRGKATQLKPLRFALYHVTFGNAELYQLPVIFFFSCTVQNSLQALRWCSKFSCEFSSSIDYSL